MSIGKFYDWCYAHRHPIFLVGLVSFFLLPEIIQKVFLTDTRFPVIVLILVFSSVLIIHDPENDKPLIITLVLIFIFFLGIWSFLGTNQKMQSIAFTLLFVYFTLITYYLFLDILQSKDVTSSVIFGAFAGYFLIGVLFFFIFALLNVAYPETLNIDMEGDDSLENVLYFSFITLTTIGYGDFAPTSTLGQKIAILEGLTGQFYIAAVMATIVGKFLSGKEK
jgi:hypothetical protein